LCDANNAQFRRIKAAPAKQITTGNTSNQAGTTTTKQQTPLEAGGDEKDGGMQ